MSGFWSQLFEDVINQLQHEFNEKGRKDRSTSQDYHSSQRVPDFRPVGVHTRYPSVARPIAPARTSIFPLLHTDHASRKVSEHLPRFHQNTPVGVFWDIENIPVPAHLRASDVVAKLRETFCTPFFEKEFLTAGDTSNQSKATLDQLNEADVLVATVNSGRNKADEKIMSRIKKFVNDWEAPAIVVLLTSDGDFKSIVKECLDKNFYVVLVRGRSVSKKLTACNPNEIHLFKNILKDVSEKPEEERPKKKRRLN